MAQTITKEQMARLAEGPPRRDGAEARWLAEGSAVLRVSISDSAKPITFATGEPPDGEEPLVLRAYMTPQAMFERLSAEATPQPEAPRDILDEVVARLRM